MTSSRAVRIGGILLAAGSSSRLGTSKQLLKIGDQTLLESTLSKLNQSKLNMVLTVLGSQANDHLAVIEGKAKNICVNENWENGIGNSIKYGIKALGNNIQELDGVAIFVCDQLALTTAHIDSMIESFQSNQERVIVSQYESAMGVPVIFPRKCFGELRHIDDKYGAKKLIEEFEEHKLLISFSKGHIDIDTPEDLTHLKNTNYG